MKEKKYKQKEKTHSTHDRQFPKEISFKNIALNIHYIIIIDFKNNEIEIEFEFVI